MTNKESGQYYLNEGNDKNFDLETRFESLMLAKKYFEKCKKENVDCNAEIDELKYSIKSLGKDYYHEAVSLYNLASEKCGENIFAMTNKAIEQLNLALYYFDKAKECGFDKVHNYIKDCRKKLNSIEHQF